MPIKRFVEGVKPILYSHSDNSWIISVLLLGSFPVAQSFNAILPIPRYASLLLVFFKGFDKKKAVKAIL